MTDLALLERKLAVLQAGHDHIETNGFDISEYEGTAFRDDTEGVETHEYDEDGLRHPRCFIGVARGAAGCEPFPDLGMRGPAHLNSDGEPDDGPELPLALAALDDAVQEFAPFIEKRDDILPYVEHVRVTNELGEPQTLDAIRAQPGRFVEAVGLYFDRTARVSKEQQEQYALDLFRSAIRTTLQEIEAAEAA